MVNKPDALTDQSDFFKSLLDHMEIGVIVADENGTIVYINDTYARFLNIDARAHIGKHATDVIANTRLHIVAQTGVAEINYPHEFKDIGYLVHRIPIKKENRIVAVLGLVLFEDARTASRLAEQLSFLESKVNVYEEELTTIRATKFTFDSIIGTSSILKTLKQKAIHAANNEFPVFITGESGTGKELFAQAVHHSSSRRVFPFIRINCAAIPKELFESEIFGYEKGAFTDAHPRGKPGKLELAHMGTVFLDEIGDLPVYMQPKLLSAIEEKVFERLGGNRVIQSDFRIIAATNRNIEKMIEKGLFRKDLYYRLSVIPLNIPPLKERREDIMPLMRHFLKSRQVGDRNHSIRSDAVACLKAHDWPGNARELQNVVEQILVSLEGDKIKTNHLPYYIGKQKRANEASQVSLKDYLLDAEKNYLAKTLAAAHYNKSEAARRLGIHRTMLYRKLAKLGLND